MQKHINSFEMLNMIKFAVNSCTNNSANLLWAWCFPPRRKQTCSSFSNSDHHVCLVEPSNDHVQILSNSWWNPLCFFRHPQITENKTSRYKVILQDINIHVNMFLLCCTCCNTQWQYFSFHVDVHIFLLWMLSLCEQNAFFSSSFKILF